MAFKYLFLFHNDYLITLSMSRKRSHIREGNFLQAILCSSAQLCAEIEASRRPSELCSVAFCDGHRNVFLSMIGQDNRMKL